MYYRVQLDVGLTSLADAKALCDYIVRQKKKFVRPRTVGELDVLCSLQYHACRHDETPPAPCGDYVTIAI